jgi:diguanylate cyclase (GGDEF)-like protein
VGGDEFVVLVPDMESRDAADIVAERILQSLRLPIEIDGLALTIGASIGFAVFPDDGDEAESLKRKADAAMYAVKSSGRDGWRPYIEKDSST